MIEQRMQNLDPSSMKSLHQEMNMKDRKRIQDKIGLVTNNRQLQT